MKNTSLDPDENPAARPKIIPDDALPDDALNARTKGFLDKEEGRRLFEIAKEASRLGPCLEIGSYCGKSTLNLGAACRMNNSILFAVDHHSGSEEQQPGEEYFDPETYDIRHGRMDTFPLFRNAIIDAGLENTVVPIVARSAVAALPWRPLAGF